MMKIRCLFAELCYLEACTQFSRCMKIIFVCVCVSVAVYGSCLGTETPWSLMQHILGIRYCKPLKISILWCTHKTCQRKYGNFRCGSTTIFMKMANRNFFQRQKCLRWYWMSSVVIDFILHVHVCHPVREREISPADNGLNELKRYP
jgi:hypothetical protein